MDRCKGHHFRTHIIGNFPHGWGAMHDVLRGDILLDLKTAMPFCNMELVGTVFRMDVFRHNGALCLNELEVYPMCYDFTSGYHQLDFQMDAVGQSISDFIASNWPDGWKA